MLEWAYGMTTVPDRRETLFPRTLSSLRTAGFERPHLFVDGCDDPLIYKNTGCDITVRSPRAKAFGNWLLSLGELFARQPNASRYALFQDDFVTYRNLRRYLESCEYQPKTYWNLYSFRDNEQRIKDLSGWVEAKPGTGRGAVALIFDSGTVRTILASREMIEKSMDRRNGHKNIDGCLVHCLEKAGWKEMVHAPTLVQHTGDVSTLRRHRQPHANSFLGEDFDAMEFNKCAAEN